MKWGAEPKLLLQPNVNARHFPVVRFVENVQLPIAIEVSDARFMKTDAGRKLGQAKVALAIAVERGPPDCPAPITIAS